MKPTDMYDRISICQIEAQHLPKAEFRVDASVNHIHSGPDLCLRGRAACSRTRLGNVQSLSRGHMGMPHPVYLHQSCHIHLPRRAHPHRTSTIRSKKTRQAISDLSCHSSRPVRTGDHQQLCQPCHHYGAIEYTLSLWHQGQGVDTRVGSQHIRRSSSHWRVSLPSPTSNRCTRAFGYIEFGRETRKRTLYACKNCIKRFNSTTQHPHGAMEEHHWQLADRAAHDGQHDTIRHHQRGRAGNSVHGPVRNRA
jgi:hypothetical protein